MSDIATNIYKKFPKKLVGINLYENNDAPIAADELWAHFALLREVS